MDNIEEIRRLRDEYETALDEAEARRSAYHQAIRKVYMSGVPLREIAEQIGISHQRVHQIVGEEPPDRKRKRRAIGAASILILLVGGALSWTVIDRVGQSHTRVLATGPSGALVPWVPCPPLSPDSVITINPVNGEILSVHSAPRGDAIVWSGSCSLKFPPRLFCQTLREFQVPDLVCRDGKSFLLPPGAHSRWIGSPSTRSAPA